MIVQGAFNKLLKPGIAAMLRYGREDLLDWVARKDEMAILHPDTSSIPIWRRRATRVEHPITAWRAWRLERKDGGWHLTSVAAECVWEGPVLRAHKRPVDPAYWDALRHKKGTVGGDHEYFSEMHDTFSLAGIWAVKTKELVLEVCNDYDVMCCGRVQLWGRVAQFQLGYRGEVCMIRELWLLPQGVLPLFNSRNDQRDFVEVNKADIPLMIHKKAVSLAADLEKRYGCEVHWGRP